jgi:hypothetical protein
MKKSNNHTRDAVEEERVAVDVEDGVAVVVVWEVEAGVVVVEEEKVVADVERVGVDEAVAEDLVDAETGDEVEVVAEEEEEEESNTPLTLKNQETFFVQGRLGL